MKEIKAVIGTRALASLHASLRAIPGFPGMTVSKAERGVRIYTVGIGTAKGEVLRTDGWSMRVSLDEAGLKTVADLTRGEYFLADSAAELKRIYQSMSSRFVMERKELEVGALFAAGAALLALLGAGLSVAWYGRVL